MDDEAFERAALRSFERAILRAFIRRAPLRGSDHPREGPAVVEGCAVTTRPLVSPVSGIAAACYLLNVDATLSDGSVRREVISGVEAFEVDDGRGRILVEPKHALLALTRQYQEGAQDQPVAAAEVLRLLRAQGADWLDQVASFTWRESFLEPNERCLVCGSLKILTHAEAVHYRETAFRPRLVAPERLPLVIADQSREQLIEALLAPEQRMPEG